MNFDEEYRLSFYKEIAYLDKNYNVYLVQNIETKRIYVKKIIEVYNIEVYNFIKKNPIENIPRIYEVIEDNEKLIVIEEYINGETLQLFLERNGILSEEKVSDILCQLCDLLEKLHSLNPPIIHRDIKPSNIIISDYGKITLIDFNASKIYYDKSFKDTKLMGTVGYAAPEQYGFSSSNIKTDIYALGVLINILLTGELPTEKRAEGFLGDIVCKCTKLDPDKRYNNVMDLKKSIELKQSNIGIRNIKIFAPVGFRSLKPINMIVASIIYAFAILIGMSMNLENATTFINIFNKFVFVVVFICMILFFGNYLDIQSKTGVKSINNFFIRNMVMILQGFTILLIGIIIIAVIETFAL